MSMKLNERAYEHAQHFGIERAAADLHAMLDAMNASPASRERR
jgi:hypothetical protein